MSTGKTNRPSKIKTFFAKRKQKKEQNTIIDMAVKIEKSRNETKKLEEELYKMTKLELVNGKLVPVEEKNKQEMGTERPLPPQQQKEKEEEKMRMETPINHPNHIQPQQQEQYVPRQQQEQYVQQQPTQEELDAYRQQFIRNNQPPIPPMQQQQRIMHQQQLQVIQVTMILTDGLKITIPVEGNSIKEFLTRLDDAIESQSVFQIDNQFINGRHIIYYGLK